MYLTVYFEINFQAILFANNVHSSAFRVQCQDVNTIYTNCARKLVFIVKIILMLHIVCI